MLNGLYPPTAGDALIFGKSIRHEMDEIRRHMGVCPQHDILFDNLTGREHLHIFGLLKGVPESQLAEEIHARLADVLLLKEADLRAGAYSGGMRRRLSIAIALLGDPKVVFLDGTYDVNFCCGRPICAA